MLKCVKNQIYQVLLDFYGYCASFTVTNSDREIYVYIYTIKHKKNWQTLTLISSTKNQVEWTCELHILYTHIHVTPWHVSNVGELTIHTSRYESSEYDDILLKSIYKTKHFNSTWLEVCFNSPTTHMGVTFTMNTMVIHLILSLRQFHIFFIDMLKWFHMNKQI